MDQFEIEQTDYRSVFLSETGLKVEILNGDGFEVARKFIYGHIITDPPYGIGLKSNCKRGVKGRGADYSITGDDDQTLVQGLIDEISGCVPLIVFASPWKPWAGDWRNLIVWNKGGGTGFGGDTKKCLRRTWDLIQVSGNDSLACGGRPESVWNINQNNAICSLHPCAKPIALMARLIETFTQPGDIICDPFMGSGTTALACIKTGRNFIGAEIDAKFYATALERITRELANPQGALL